MAYLGNSPINRLYTTQAITLAAGQTVVNVNYTPGMVLFVKNGAILEDTDYTATNGSTVTLTNAANAGDVLRVISLSQFAVANALALSGGAMSGPMTVLAATANDQPIQFGQAGGRLLNVQVFTTSGTYTPTPGTNSIIVEVLGGGGGGGGCEATGASQCEASVGGGAGGYGILRSTTPPASTAVTIGAGGVYGYLSTDANGGNGGTTSFGSLVSATGGTGGTGQPTASTGTYANGVVGGSSTGGTINVPGQSSGSAWASSSQFYLANGVASNGADSPYGAGGIAKLNAKGADGIGYGSGGGGTTIGQATTRQAGGAGAPGLAIVWEYA